MDLSGLIKKMYKYIIIAVIVVVGLILIFWLMSLAKNKKLSFSAIEDKMVNAAKDYMEEDEKKLPILDNEVVISVKTLVENGNMKELSSYTKKDIVCNGEVVVKNNSGYYSYIPYLNCGKEYKTQTLGNYIIENSEIVSTDKGLYSVGNEYIYRGEFVDNFVSFAGQLWRIIKIDSNGDIRIVQKESKQKSEWDDRYNIQKDQVVGINDYEKSRIKETLDNNFEKLFKDDEKAKIVSKDICIGERYQQDTTKDGSTECAKKLPNQKLGLLQTNEYLYASIDPNCTSTLADACQNYNYLALSTKNFWTQNANAENTYSAYYIAQSYLNITKTIVSKNVFMTLYLDKNTLYESGTGTEEDPYIIK